MTPPTASAAAREPSRAVLQQAAEWYARLRDGHAGAQARMDWQQWLRAAEEHQIAWRYVEDIRCGFEPLRDVPSPRLTAHGLCAANDRLRARRRVLASAAALAGSGLLGWLGWRENLLPGYLTAWAADARTAIGEQRETALADGSRVWLNTASAIDVHFDARERRLRLLAGEIFIDTAPDARRPFLVDTGHGRLRALGTRFNVRQDDDETRLAVYEGAVEIRTASSDATRIVPAGQQARFTKDDITSIETADFAREAWTRGALVADNITLGEVVQELRRYRQGQLDVGDDVAKLKVYGNFPIRDTDRVLAMLAGALPIRIDRSDPARTRIEASRQP